MNASLQALTNRNGRQADVLQQSFQKPTKRKNLQPTPAPGDSPPARPGAPSGRSQPHLNLALLAPQQTHAAFALAHTRQHRTRLKRYSLLDRPAAA